MRLSQSARPGGEGAGMEAADRDMVISQTHPLLLMLNVGGGYCVETDTTHSRSPDWERGRRRLPACVCVCVCVCPSSPGRCRLMTCYSCYTVLPTHPSSSLRPELRQSSHGDVSYTYTGILSSQEFGFRHYTVRKKIMVRPKGGHRPMPPP